MYQIVCCVFKSWYRTRHCSDKFVDHTLRIQPLCGKLDKIRATRKGRMLNEIKQAIKLFNIPLKPTYYHQTRQHNVACDEKLLEHQLVLAKSKTRLNQLSHCSLNYHCSKLIP